METAITDKILTPPLVFFNMYFVFASISPIVSVFDLQLSKFLI